MRRRIILLAICSLSIQNLVGCSDIAVVVPSSSEFQSSPGFASTPSPVDPGGNPGFTPTPESTNVSISTEVTSTPSPSSTTASIPSPKSSPSATPKPTPTPEENSGFEKTPTIDYTGSDSDFKPITIPSPEDNT